MKVDVTPKEVVEKTTDDRGRFNLGTEYANQDVRLLIVEADDE